MGSRKSELVESIESPQDGECGTARRAAALPGQPPALARRSGASLPTALPVEPLRSPGKGAPPLRIAVRPLSAAGRTSSRTRESRRHPCIDHIRRLGLPHRSALGSGVGCGIHDPRRSGVRQCRLAKIAPRFEQKCECRSPRDENRRGYSLEGSITSEPRFLRKWENRQGTGHGTRQPRPRSAGAQGRTRGARAGRTSRTPELPRTHADSVRNRRGRSLSPNTRRRAVRNALEPVPGGVGPVTKT